jgi:two-component system response regulator BasR
MHLLIVEDDIELGAALCKALAGHGYTSEWVRRASDAKSFASATPYACALLDLGLPDGDGLAVLRAWRAAGFDAAVIVLTARDGLADRVAGLDDGADDYVLKPVAIEELVSRIRAVTRRVGGHTSSIWTAGRLRVDTRSREVELDGVPVPVSASEFAILLELVRQAGQVVPKHRVAHALRPLGDPVEANTLEVYIYNLRRKLGSDTIRTVRGVGYSIAA